jgi:hypothetical protein
MAEPESQVETAFTTASQEAREGRAIEPVLADYPEHAVEVRELLRLTAAIKRLPHPELSTEALDNIRKRTLFTLQNQSAPASLSGDKANRGRRGISGFFSRFTPALYAAAGALAALLLVGGVMLWNMLTQQGIPGATDVSSYSGIITSIDGPRWMIGDTVVLIDDTTEIHGTPAVGAMMRCIGEELPGDRMKALEVWIEESPKILPTAPAEPSGGVYGPNKRLNWLR